MTQKTRQTGRVYGAGWLRGARVLAVGLIFAVGFVFIGAGAKPTEPALHVAAGETATEPGEVPALGPLPEVEAQNADLVKLGRWLFFDNRISGDADRSCSDCHIPSKGWADGQDLSAGYVGTEYFRNSKTVVNAVHAKYFYWDARLDGQDMPTQVRDSITESHFMAGDGRIMHQRLKNIPVYVELFDKAFGDEPSFNRILNSISAFERTLVSRNVPFDKYLEGDKSAISAQAKQGLDLFKGKAGCIHCHNGPMLSDYEPHNLGVPHNPKIISEVKRHITLRSMSMFLGVPNYHNLTRDPGFFMVSKEYKDFGSFVTPSLREVSRTAPYMHNGMLPTLEAVLEFYNEGGGADENKDALIEPLGLTADEKAALLAFLGSLSGDPIEIDIPKESVPKYNVLLDWYETDN